MLSFLHSPTFTSIHDHWETIALTRRTFVGKVTSLLLNMLLNRLREAVTGPWPSISHTPSSRTCRESALGPCRRHQRDQTGALVVPGEHGEPEEHSLGSETCAVIGARAKKASRGLGAKLNRAPAAERRDLDRVQSLVTQSSKRPGYRDSPITPRARKVTT